MPSIHPTYHPAHFVFPTKRGGGRKEGKTGLYWGGGGCPPLEQPPLCKIPCEYHLSWGGEGGARDREEGGERGGAGRQAEQEGLRKVWLK